jgi:predicted RNA methylase
VAREDESEDTLLEEIIDTALLIEKYEKVLKIEGYMFAR